MNVREAGTRNSIGDVASVELARADAIKPIYAMDDTRVGLGEAVEEGVGQEQVLG